LIAFTLLRLVYRVGDQRLLDDLPSRRRRQRFGRARRRSFERPFKYKKEEPLNTLIYLDRDRKRIGSPQSGGFRFTT
jgi:hypothetical protein